jgi:Ribbon-helix-helix protein, copG family
MPYPRMGRTERLTIRLRPKDATRLTAAARARGVARTVIIEELVRTLPESPTHGAAGTEHSSVLDKTTP